MYFWLIIWLVVLVAGIVLLLLVYSSLIRNLKTSHPDRYRHIGSPELFMVSPKRSLRLQKFIYKDSRESDIDPKVASRAKFLGFATPVYVALLFVLYMVWAISLLR